LFVFREYISVKALERVHQGTIIELFVFLIFDFNKVRVEKYPKPCTRTDGLHSEAHLLKERKNATRHVGYRNLVVRQKKPIGRKRLKKPKIFLDFCRFGALMKKQKAKHARAISLMALKIKTRKRD
jgi:hypothetical protein